MRRLARDRRPSTGTILGGIALFVALGGTALAATGQLVNIADPSNSSYVAKVDSSGALRTSSPPGRPFASYAYVGTGTTALSPATKVARQERREVGHSGCRTGRMPY